MKYIKLIFMMILLFSENTHALSDGEYILGDAEGTPLFLVEIRDNNVYKSLSIVIGQDGKFYTQAYNFDLVIQFIIKSSNCLIDEREIGREYKYALVKNTKESEEENIIDKFKTLIKNLL